MDPATERIIGYLAQFQVPINVALFRYFQDGDRAYLARTWLLADTDTGDPVTPRRSSAKETWNGQDWYVTFGEESGIRVWEDARQYGFISAGGGAWYSRSLHALPQSGRVFVYLPKKGYAAVGTVTGPAVPFDEAVLTVDGQPRKMTDLQLRAQYQHAATGPDTEEYVVPVSWIKTLDGSAAIWEKGMFANQNSACKLRNRFTLETLIQGFALDE